jgi:hypothetical protein
VNDTHLFKENQTMQPLLQIKQEILAKGKIDRHELELLHRQLYAEGKIDRRGVEFLVELHKRVRPHTPAFEQFFFQAIKDHILGDGRIVAEEVAWLRLVLFTDGRIMDEERKLLNELRGEARLVSAEFEELFVEGMKMPQKQHTCG